MNTFSKRFFTHIFFLFCLVSFVLIRYGYLMLYLSVKDPVLHIQKTSKVLRRGDIYDRNGNILAIDTQAYNLTCWTPNLTNAQDKEVVVNSLFKILNIPKQKIYNKLNSSQGEIYIKRKITSQEANLVKKDISKYGLKCLDLKEDSQRTYPNLHLASPVIGFVGFENKGLDGIEYTYDSYLTPSLKGKSLYGNNVYLTIDLDVQEKLESILDEIVIKHNPDNAIGIVMDARTGEILAMGDRPSYNPNIFQKYPEKFRKNYAISQIYEPGSVFKMFTIASFYDLGGITPQTKIDASHSYRIANSQPITDIANYGFITPERIIMYSSNVGAAYASDTVDKYSFYYMLRKFGFGQDTGLSLNGEQSGILENTEKWNARTKPTMAFGQAIGTTAIQIITASTVFANSGDLLKPIIVKKISSEDGKTILQSKRQVVRHVISKRTTSIMLDHMQKVSQPGGTGWRVRIPNINISIKTGTAQISTKGKKEADSKIGYSSSAYLASSLALVPTEDPQYIVYIAINYPKGKEYYGGIIVPPLIKEMLLYLINHYYLKRYGDETYYVK